MMHEKIFVKEIVDTVKGLCECGYKLPLASELLYGARDFICPKCGKDNTLISMEDE